MNLKFLLLIISLQLLITLRESCAAEVTAEEEFEEDEARKTLEEFEDNETRKKLCKQKILSKIEEDVRNAGIKNGVITDHEFAVPSDANLEGTALEIFETNASNPDDDGKVEGLNLLIRAEIRDYCYELNGFKYYEVRALEELLPYGKKASSRAGRRKMSTSNKRRWRDAVNASSLSLEVRERASLMITGLFPSAFKYKSPGKLAKIGRFFNRTGKKIFSVCRRSNYKKDIADLIRLTGGVRKNQIPNRGQIPTELEAQFTFITEGAHVNLSDFEKAERHFIFSLLLASTGVEGMLDEAVESLGLMLRFVVHEYCRAPSHYSRKYVIWIEELSKRIPLIWKYAHAKLPGADAVWSRLLDRSHFSVLMKKSIRILVKLIWAEDPEKLAARLPALRQLEAAVEGQSLP